MYGVEGSDKGIDETCYHICVNVLKAVDRSKLFGSIVKMHGDSEYYIQIVCMDKIN